MILATVCQRNAHAYNEWKEFWTKQQPEAMSKVQIYCNEMETFDVIVAKEYYDKQPTLYNVLARNLQRDLQS